LGIIIPTDELIFFRGVGIPPTSYYTPELSGYLWCSLGRRPQGAPATLALQLVAEIPVGGATEPKALGQGLRRSLCTFRMVN